MLSFFTKKEKVNVKEKQEFFGEVPAPLRIVDLKTHEETYVKDLNLVIEYFGFIAIQNRYFDLKSLSHEQLVYKVGSEAMNLLSGTSFKYWTDDLSILKKGIWPRLVWRLSAVYALGFIFENYSVRDSNPLGPVWNPALSSITKFNVNQKVYFHSSNRSISGSSISQAIFMKLFPEYFEDDFSPMISLAIMDVFSASPNKDNPLFVVLKKAMKKQLIKDYFPIPFFWDLFIFHVFNDSPDDIVLYNQMKTKTQNINKINSLTDPVISELSVKHTQLKVDSTHIEVIEPHDIDIDIDVLVAFLGKHVKLNIEKGIYKINETGALIHYINAKYYFVFPIALDRLAEGYNSITESKILSGSKLSKLLLNANVIRIMKGQINVVGKSPIPIQLAEINKADVQKFIRVDLKLSSNNKIDILSCL